MQALSSRCCSSGASASTSAIAAPSCPRGLAAAPAGSARRFSGPVRRRRRSQIAAAVDDADASSAASAAASAASSAAAAANDATAPIYNVDDPVVTAVFSLATVALTIVTLGVAYLSITSWIDSRNEEAERKKAEDAERSRALNPSATSVPRRKKKASDVLTSRGGGKGFSK